MARWMKWILAVGLGVIAPAAAHAQNAAVTNFCTSGATNAVTQGLPSGNTLQGVVPSCTVTVYNTGTANLATIYANVGGSALSNPFTASQIGQFVFYAPTSACYDVVLSGGVGPNIFSSPITLTDVCSGGGGGGLFANLTSGTNTTATMLVGSGASLGATGTGTIAATSVPASGITGTTLASNVVNSSLATVGPLLTTTQMAGLATLNTPSGTHPSNQFAPQSIQRNNTINVNGSGWSFGNVGGWTVSQGQQDTMIVNQRGIAHGYTINEVKRATGDNAALYTYSFCDGGATAGSDEGCTNANFEGGETSGYFHGTISSTSGTGDKQPVLNFSSGADALTDGAILLDISKGTVAGSLNGFSSSFQSSYMTQLPVTGVTVNGVAGPLPLSTAYGLIQSALPQQNSTADSPQAVTVNVNLGTIGTGTPPFVVGVATLGGAWYGEQTQITAVGTPVAGVQSVTMLTRNPNPIYNYLFQGGLAGQYLSFDANLALSGYRSSYEVLGSIDGTHLIYFLTIGAGEIESITLPQVGSEAATTTGANAGFHLYPGAEIVKNDPSAISPTLEANAVPWATGDVIENPHRVEQGGHGIWVTTQRNSPCYFQYGCEGVEVDANGDGVNGAFSMFKAVNFAQNSIYQDGGGPLYAPTLLFAQGSYGTLWSNEYGPQHGGSVIYIDQLANGISASSWTGTIPVINFHSWGCGQWNLTPSTGFWSACALKATAAFQLGSGTTLSGNQGNGPNLMHCDAGTFTAGDILTVAADGSCQDGGPASASGVASINSTAGAFTFTGPGVGCSGTTCTFSGTGTGVGSFSSGSLLPLFSTAVANPTTAPALSFTLTNAPAYSVWGNFGGSSAAPSYSNAPVFSAANLTNFPTFNQSTTGQAGTVATINGLIAAGTNVTLSGLGTSASPYTIASTGGGGGGGSSVGTAGQVQMVGSTAGSFAASHATDNGSVFSLTEPLAVGSGGTATQMSTTATTVASLPAASSLPPVTTGGNTTYTFLQVMDANPNCATGGGSTIIWCYSNGTAWISAANTSFTGAAAGGALNGTYPNPGIATVPASALPALTGDCTTTAGTVATNCAHAYASLPDGSPIAWTTTGNISNATVTLAHATTTRALNVTGLASGDYGTLIISQDATGGAYLTGGTGCSWYVHQSAGGWIASTAFFTTFPAANTVNILTWTYAGGNCYASLT